MAAEPISSRDLIRDEPSWPAAPSGFRRARQSPGADVVNGILEPDTNIVVWRRMGSVAELSEDALAYAAWLATGAFEVPLDDRGRPVGVALPLAAGRDELVDDWSRSLRRFDQLTGGAPIDAKLGVITTDRCRLFHADFNRIRWLCTYAGPGTQWVADGDVDRAAVLVGELPADEVNRRLIPDPNRIQQVRRGDVVLLKGNDHPGNEGSGAIHRSPPIAGTGQRRLVLTLSWHAS